MIILPTNSPLAMPHACDWIRKVSQRETDTIGFLPHEARARHHRQGLIYTTEECAELCAFCIRSPLQKTGTVQIHQSFTIDEARRLLHQTALIESISHLAREEGATALVLKCGDDLAANLFWRMIGFRQFDQTRGGRRRGRLINHFRLPLTRIALPRPIVEIAKHQDRS